MTITSNTSDVEVPSSFSTSRTATVRRERRRAAAHVAREPYAAVGINGCATENHSDGISGDHRIFRRLSSEIGLAESACRLRSRRNVAAGPLD
jgi:hypothetical protein